MATDIDVRDVNGVYSTPSWRIFTKYIAVATGVTDDGRTVQGLGTDRWSGEAAMDDAVENLKRNVKETDFSFRITAIEGGHANVRIDFLEEQGVYRTTGSNRGMSATKRVEISASKDGRTVSANDDESGFSWDQVGFNLSGNNGWSAMLAGALESAESRFERVGTTAVDE